MKPDLKFLLQHPAHFIALGFGSGLAPKAPGTFGTLVAFPLFWLLSPYSFSVQLAVILVLFLLGIYLCHKTGMALGVMDHGSIVWDEVVAMMFILAMTPRDWVLWPAAFVLFRLFDIWKPFPIRQLDAHVKGGFGVMLDDAVAAVYAIVCLLPLVTWIISQR